MENFWYLTFLFNNYWDIILVPLMIFIIFNLAKGYRNSMIHSNSYYKYFLNGLMLKVLGSFLLFVVFTYYYQSGDTFGYFFDNRSLKNLFFQSPISYLKVIFGERSPENYSFFSSETGWIRYWNDPNAFFVERLTSFITILSFTSYVLTNIYVAVITFSGNWILFKTLAKVYPNATNQLAIAILFIPSVVFWGSGLMKDSITLCAFCWYFYAVYSFFFLNKRKISLIIIAIVCSYIIISIKAYIFAALIPATILWLFFGFYKKIRMQIFKILAIPVIMFAIFFSTIWLFNTLKNELEIYALDKVLQYAVVIQQDLKQDYYGGTSFDIGDFDPTVSGVLSKLPKALMATYFMPFLWQVRSPLILLSALESLFLLYFTIRTLFSVGFFKFFKIIFKEPLLIFTFSFSIIFGFSVGLTTANFGSLVRYKIPCLIFFAITLILVGEINRLSKEQSQ